MAKVHLLSSVPEGDPSFPDFAREDLERMRRCARLDLFRIHELTADPSEADLIIFVERAHAAGKYLEHVRRHPVYRQFRDKCFVCNSRYFGIPIIPGVYGQVARDSFFLPARIKSGHYTEIYDKPHIEYDTRLTERTYLYSFVGAVSTWPVVRGELAKLRHPRGMFIDTSKAKGEVEAEEGSPAKAQYQASYVDVVNRSKFVLCPRGDAVSSMRLFEVMKMGRAPVVISDKFVYPEGPAWETFSVHVAERDMASIPEILEAREGEAEEMGHRARRAYEEWFAEDVYFHRVVEWCMDIQRKRLNGDTLLQYVEYLKFLQPFHLRRVTSAQLWNVRRQVRPRRAVSTGEGAR